MHCAVIIPVDPENTQRADQAVCSVQVAAQADLGPFGDIVVIHVNCTLNDLNERGQAYHHAVRQAHENAIEWLFLLDEGDVVYPYAFQSVFVQVEEQDAIFGLLSEQLAAGQDIRERQPQVRKMSRFEELLCNDPEQTLAIGHLVRTEVALALGFNGGIADDYYLKLWDRYRCCKIDQTLCVQRSKAYREYDAEQAALVNAISVRHQQLLDAYAHLLAAGTLKLSSAEVLLQQALRLSLRGRVKLAEQLFQLVLQYDSDAYNQACALKNLKRPAEALECLARIVAENPGHVQAWNQMGTLLQKAGSHEEALDCFERGLALDPDDPELFINKGIALRKLKRYDEALESCSRSLARRPKFDAAFYVQGLLLNDLGYQDKALENYAQVLGLGPEPELAAMALHESGTILRVRGLYDQALECYQRELALYPEYCPFTQGEALYCRQLMCDWQDFQAIGTRLLRDIDAGKAVSTTFPIFALPSTRAQQRRCSELYIENGTFTKREATAVIPDYRHAKIRLGYFSADFHSHPVAYLTAELFELHDRSRFEIIAFSLGPPVKDAIRSRLERGFDRFMDVREQSDQQIAELARALEIDIAIDLSGHTQESRPGIFARRIAPVQAHYLGHAGTLGSRFIDYLIADPVVVAEEHLSDYAEKIVFLPDSFMVSDRHRQIDTHGFTRAEAGLPENGFVYCAFNNPNKITPQVFDVWMNIMRTVERSVLWLSSRNQWCMANLRREAEQRGVSGDRIIFASRMAQSEQHLARHRLADLFLDTFYYGAHTTANDALWAGLPVLTWMGDTFASRVGASLLSAIGLPELIAPTPHEYQALAIELAGDPEKLLAIKNKLAANRDTAPLFDTPRFARHLEAAYLEMLRRWQAGLDPEHIQVKTHDCSM